MSDKEKIIMLENQLEQASKNLNKAEGRLDWLENFLQLSSSNTN